MSFSHVDELLFEADQEYPTFPQRRYLCNFCGHGKRVHRAQGCRPNNRACPQGCKRFLP